MKNKIGKSFSVFLVLIVISILFLAYTNTDAATNSPVIGDLRCPLEISDKDNVRCETVEKNGVVVEVRMIYGNPNDIQIIKYVRKTEDLGTYEVEFEVKGNVEQRKIPEPAYVSVILDMSQTIKGQEKEAIAAAKKLAKTLVPVEGGSNFYVSLWQFGTDAFQRQKLENKNFDKTNFLTYNGLLIKLFKVFIMS